MISTNNCKTGISFFEAYLQWWWQLQCPVWPWWFPWHWPVEPDDEQSHSSSVVHGLWTQWQWSCSHTPCWWDPQAGSQCVVPFIVLHVALWALTFQSTIKGKQKYYTSHMLTYSMWMRSTRRITRSRTILFVACALCAYVLINYKRKQKYYTSQMFTYSMLMRSQDAVPFIVLHAYVQINFKRKTEILYIIQYILSNKRNALNRKFYHKFSSTVKVFMNIDVRYKYDKTFESTIKLRDYWTMTILKGGYHLRPITENGYKRIVKISSFLLT